MFSVVTIQRVERSIYDDVFHSGGRIVERRPAPIEAFYEIEVLVDRERHTFEAEVRRGPHGLQIDWSDQFQDFLAQHGCSEDDVSQVGQAIVEAHGGGFSLLPLHPGELPHGLAAVRSSLVA